MIGAVADDCPENLVKPLVLRAALEEVGLPIEDGRVVHDVPGEGEVRTDLWALRARVHVPGVIDIFCALLVCLCGERDGYKWM